MGHKAIACHDSPSTAARAPAGRQERLGELEQRLAVTSVELATARTMEQRLQQRLQV